MKSKKPDPPVTRSEFLSVTSKFVTKEELNKLANEVVNIRFELKEVKETMATKEDIREILNAIDAFAKKAEVYDHKALIHTAQLENHEERIRNLEKVA